jgi:hypothetical protein
MPGAGSPIASPTRTDASPRIAAISPAATWSRRGAPAGANTRIEVLRLDRDSLAIVERVPAISTGQDGIALAAGDLWIEGTADGQPVVHRLRPPAR